MEENLESHLVLESLSLLLYGMGVVFVFLFLLVIATTAMSHIVNRFFPEPVPERVTRKALTTGVDDLTLKIIQAALDKHRRRK